MKFPFRNEDRRVEKICTGSSESKIFPRTFPVFKYNRYTYIFTHRTRHIRDTHATVAQTGAPAHTWAHVGVHANCVACIGDT